MVDDEEEYNYDDDEDDHDEVADGTMVTEMEMVVVKVAEDDYVNHGGRARTMAMVVKR